MQDDASSLETLPRGTPSREEGTARFVGYLSTLLIALGWLAGLGLLYLTAVSGVVVLRSEPQRIPLGLLDEFWPVFRDHPTVYGLAVVVGGLLLSLVTVLVVAGLGHVLRLFVSLERGLRGALRRLEERA
jgi:hypothetical protein